MRDPRWTDVDGLQPVNPCCANSLCTIRELFYENSVDLLRALKKHFGYDQFRPLQEEIIRDALAGSDVFVLGANPARKQPAKFYCR